MPLFRRRRAGGALEPRCTFVVFVADLPRLDEAAPGPLTVGEAVRVHSPAGALVEVEPFLNEGPDPLPPPETWEPMRIDDDLARRVRGARYGIAVALREPGASLPEAVVFTTELASRLAEAGDGAVRDNESFRFFSPGAWRVDDPLGELDPREHVVVHAVNEGASWIHTHGLVKFGRPEFEVYDVPPDLAEPLSVGLLDMAAYVMGGALIEPGQTLGDPDVPIRAVVGGRDREHWQDTPVLELVGEEGFRAWIAG